jgi:hypothetical protein
MSATRYDTNKRAVEELCLAYRAIVEDPPYSAIDRELLSIAARQRSYEWVRHLIYVAAVLLVVAFGLTAMFAATVSHGLRWPRQLAGVGNIVRNWMGSSEHPGIPLPRGLALYQVASQSTQREQAQSSDHPAPVRSGCFANGQCPGGTANVSGTAGMKVSDFLIEPLKAAQAAQRAAGDAKLARDSQLEIEERQVEIQELLVAQASRGQKTAFDEFMIDAMLGTAYTATRDFAKAVPLLQAAALSPYASPALRKGYLQAAEAMLNSLPRK